MKTITLKIEDSTHKKLTNAVNVRAVAQGGVHNPIDLAVALIVGAEDGGVLTLSPDCDILNEEMSDVCTSK